MNCVFCQDRLFGPDGKKLKVSKCGHVFHLDCLEDAMKHNTSVCPLCNQRLMMRHTGPLHLQQDDLNEQNLATKSPGINASKVSIGTDNKNCSDENEISQRNENAVPSEIIAPNKENVASNAQDPVDVQSQGTQNLNDIPMKNHAHTITNRRYTNSFNREERVIYTVRPPANVRVQLAIKPNTVTPNGDDHGVNSTVDIQLEDSFASNSNESPISNHSDPVSVTQQVANVGNQIRPKKVAFRRNTSYTANDDDRGVADVQLDDSFAPNLNESPISNHSVSVGATHGATQQVANVGNQIRPKKVAFRRNTSHTANGGDDSVNSAADVQLEDSFGPNSNESPISNHSVSVGATQQIANVGNQIRPKKVTSRRITTYDRNVRITRRRNTTQVDDTPKVWPKRARTPVKRYNLGVVCCVCNKSFRVLSEDYGGPVVCSIECFKAGN